MSILSDAEIKQLCVPPQSFDQLNEGLYADLIDEQNLKGWPTFDPAVEALKKEIREKATMRYIVDPADFKPMISPYCEKLIREVFQEVEKPTSVNEDGSLNMTRFPTQPRKVLSYGQSSYGYDVSLAADVKIFSNINAVTVDPKSFDERSLVDAVVKTDATGSFIILPPNSYMLGRTVEHFNMPRDVTAIFLAKSTYARVGISVNATPAEAGWSGVLVLEVANQTTLPVKVYVNEGIAQALFFRGNQPCSTTYADRGGKYMNQAGITLAKV
jgi:dCTP deaminase